MANGAGLQKAIESHANLSVDVLDHADRLFAAYRRLKTPIWVYDIDKGRIAFANKAALEIWQADSEVELCARDLGGDMSTTVRERLGQYQKSFVTQNRYFSELWTLFPKGEPVHITVVFFGFTLTDGRMAMLCEVVSKNLDEEPETIRSTEALLHTDVMITLFDANGQVLYTNPSSQRSLLDHDESFRARIDDDYLYDHVVGQFQVHGEYQDVVKVQTSAGEKWHNMTIKSCPDSVSGKPAFLMTEVDVTAMKKVQERESFLALHDPLTGLFNRSFVQKYIEDNDALKRDHPKLRALFYIDIDRFKTINDTQGHEFGDVVLAEIARRISKVLGPEHSVSRLGGDEFVIFITETDEAIDSLADQVMSCFLSPVEWKEFCTLVSCSLGIARYPHDGDVFDILLRNADIALYAAKKSGRKQYCFFEGAMYEDMVQRRQLEADILEAIEQNDFDLHYQARVDAHTKNIVGVEALARWHHAERGSVPPSEFIPICEETGMIEELGAFVLKSAVRQQAEWARAGHNIIVSINLSPRQFHAKNLLSQMQEISRYPDVIPALIEFEITESMLMGNSEQVLKLLTQIRALGFRISLDDFGTGYSNLAYIPLYPISCIKIDKSFIDQLPQSNPVIGLITTLAAQIGATIVAEGVETNEQLAYLENWPCGQYQGFLFHEPEASSGVTALLNKRKEQMSVGHVDGNGPLTRDRISAVTSE